VNSFVAVGLISRRKLMLTLLAVGSLFNNTFAQTVGTASLAVTLRDYNGSGANHWTVVWVTTQSGAFVKTLWKQGTKYAFNSSQWTTHTPQWNVARGGTTGSTLVDGYTSATATSYAGTNSPILLTWNGRDTNNAVVPDGNYKFWVQYAEDSGAGPHTTNGLLWVKGPAGATNTYPNLGATFASMQVVWKPNAPVTVAPTITSSAPPASGTVGVPYTFSSTATGTAPIGFTASGLPLGLQMNPTGTISGIPIASGVFPGTITASNGTLPNATQPFSILIETVPVVFAPASISGSQVLLSGTGPANGIFAVLVNTDLSPASPWAPLLTNTFDASGHFAFTNTLEAASPPRFFKLRVP
jgi:hypothetical protein